MLKVGMRVKLVSHITANGNRCIDNGLPIGAEGVIVCAVQEKWPVSQWDWVVDFPKHPGIIAPGELSATEYAVNDCMLAPVIA